MVAVPVSLGYEDPSGERKDEDVVSIWQKLNG